MNAIRTNVIFQLVNGGMDKYLAIDEQMILDESDRLLIAIESSEVLLVEDKRDGCEEFDC